MTNGNGIAANPFIDVNDFTITLSGDVDGAGLVTNLGKRYSCNAVENYYGPSNL